jgi:hypothetical protein
LSLSGRTKYFYTQASNNACKGAGIRVRFWHGREKMAQFSDLVGQTITNITGMEVGSEQINIETESGKSYRMYHSPDCCESVQVEDVCGDVNDLLDSLIVQADEESNSDPLEGATQPSDSFTWTFYRIATAKGLVVLRWLGESNGYYSESVSFEEN